MILTYQKIETELASQIHLSLQKHISGKMPPVSAIERWVKKKRFRPKNLKRGYVIHYSFTKNELKNGYPEKRYV